MKISRWAYLAAILLAVVAGVSVYAYQAGTDSRAMAGKQAVSVVVAKHDIAAGVAVRQALADGLLGVERFPKAAAPEMALGRIGEAQRGMVFGVAVPAGQIVLSSQLTELDSLNSALLQVPKGQIALSISVDDASRVANFVTPGAAVVAYYTPADSSATVVLLPKATVLAVGGQTAVQVGVQPSSGNTALVTLALSPGDAARVVLAGKTGSFNLGLLGSGASLAQGSAVTSTDVVGAGK